MSDYNPKPENKFTFGLWTVGNRGADPFGSAVRGHKPQTDGSRRFIQLPPSVSEVLGETLQRRAEYAKSERWEKDCGLVFTTSVGTPVEYRNVITHFKKVISETGLPNIRFHDLRHTVATLLLSKEINPKTVQKQLGHSSINLTINRYSHVIKSMRDIAANALEDVVRSD